MTLLEIKRRAEAAASGVINDAVRELQEYPGISVVGVVVEKIERTRHDAKYVEFEFSVRLDVSVDP